MLSSICQKLLYPTFLLSKGLPSLMGRHVDKICYAALSDSHSMSLNNFSASYICRGIGSYTESHCYKTLLGIFGTVATANKLYRTYWAYRTYKANQDGDFARLSLHQREAFKVGSDSFNKGWLTRLGNTFTQACGGT